MSGTGVFRIPTDHTGVNHTQNSSKKPKLAESSGFLLLFCQTSNTRETVCLLFIAIVKNKKPNAADKDPNYTNHNAAEK